MHLDGDGFWNTRLLKWVLRYETIVAVIFVLRLLLQS